MRGILLDMQAGLHQAMTSAARIQAGNPNHSLASLRSSLFVFKLAEHFHSEYESQPAYAVFSRLAGWHKDMFGVQEFLFDIAVLECGTVPAVQPHIDLPFVRKAIWLVESEFERNSRDVLHDLSKLKVGCSEKNLLIATQFSNMNKQIDMLAQVSDGIKGELYLALLPHPIDWQVVGNVIQSYRLVHGSWTPDSLVSC